MSNRNMLNSSTFNGSGFAVGVVAAASIIACSASISVQGVLTKEALSPTYSVAHFVAEATRTAPGISSVISRGVLSAEASHIQPAFAHASGEAQIVAYVLREVQGMVWLSGTANVQAIPAGILGSSAVLTGASLQAEATKIQPGLSRVQGSGVVAPIGDATVTRYVEVQGLFGSAQVRAETTINGVMEVYGEFVGSSNLHIIEDGLVSRQANASLMNSAAASASGTHIHPGRASHMGVALLLAGDPHIAQIPFSVVRTSASFLATATREHNPVAKSQGVAQLRGRASVAHGSTKASFKGQANWTVHAKMRRYVKANVVGRASAAAVATRTLKPGVMIEGASTFLAQALRTVHVDQVSFVSLVEVSAQAQQTVRNGAAQLPVNATLEGIPDITWRYPEAIVNGVGTMKGAAAVTVRQGASVLKAQAHLHTIADTTIRQGISDFRIDGELEGRALRTTYGFSDVLAQTITIADPTRFTFASGNIEGVVGIYADTRMNLDSYDPPERTFNRPAQETVFSRPSADTVFRRAA